VPNDRALSLRSIVIVKVALGFVNLSKIRTFWQAAIKLFWIRCRHRRRQRDRLNP
jgi:hypothetical protein